MDSIILKRSNKYIELPVNKNVVFEDYTFNKIGKKLISRSEGIEKEILPYDWHKLSEDKEILYSPNNIIRLVREKYITIGREHSDINIKDLNCNCIIAGNELYFSKENANETMVFINNELFEELEYNITIGDTILIDNYIFTILKDEIVIKGDISKINTKLLELAPFDEPFEDFPKYKRSPRIIKRLKNKTIEIKDAPKEKTMEKRALAQIVIPPIVMMLVTVAISILLKRGLYVLMFVAGSIVTTIFSVIRYVSDKKEYKEYNEKLKEVYSAYLLRKRKEIHEAYEEEKEVYNYNYPNIKQIEEMIKNYNHRIYERSSNDSDFLTVSLGYTSGSTNLKIEVNYDELSLEKDKYEDEARQIKKEFSTIDGKPVIVDLKNAHLGIVGEKSNIHEQLKIIISQLTFFHSYHDIELITIYDEKYEEEFEWINWYPHSKVHQINVLGSINNERKRDQVLGSLHQILKERKMRIEESKKEGAYIPHFVFIIDEPKLIMDHSIMEYLDKEGYSLGFSIIYTSYLKSNLPENIDTVVILENSEEGTLVLNEKELVNQNIELQKVEGINLEWMARNLSVIEHVKGIVSQIPESITFFEMYNIEHPDELNVKARWDQNVAYKTLAVPLGVRGTEDYVYLNLHEKAHGPHGLVAGTTGSGKSEILQSYILSLAINYHPHEVGFLLIDYKGGGMASLFRNLPHLLGVITNLDGSESMRALASIKSELARRQLIFNAFDVNHIDDYSKLFKLGEAEEPMPHLFIISDEFAELKKEQPEFMSELVSTARIGRSLGVHLILATQKPTGVVDDQIWSNSKFKLALKVQNEADSKEVIKTPDAANITEPGRAYLQVGNNEIYELFQSAWSGADYVSVEEEERIDDRIYIINDLGQGELINEDLSDKREVEELQQTELDVTVDYLKEIYEQEDCVAVKRPWLPPLKKQIVTPSKLEEELPEELDLNLNIGRIDIPERQEQKDYSIDLVEEGNILYIASSGYGKTTFLTTSILSLAQKNKVENLNFYILDFGNNALVSLNKLNHTADYITFDDEERLGKFIRIIENELSERKKKLAEKMVQNVSIYNQISEDKIKAIVIVIDNYDVVKELGFEIEDFFTKISRDGQGLGIYLLATATRSNAMRYATMNNFKNKIAGYNFDETEVNMIVGRSKYKQSEIKGRVLVKHDDEVNMMQMYVMDEFKNDIEYNKSISNIIDKINEKTYGVKAPRIPVLPEILTYETMIEYEKQQDKDIYLGLDKESVELCGINRDMTPFVIIGESGIGKTDMLKIILKQISEENKVYLFDSKKLELYSNRTKENIEYIDNEEKVEDFVIELEEEIEYRQMFMRKKLEENKTLSPKEISRKLEPLYIIADDWDDFVELTNLHASKLGKLFELSTSLGITTILTANSSKMKGFDDITKFAKAATDGLVMGDQGTSNIFPLRSMKELPAYGDGLLFNNGTYIRIKLPKIEIK